MIFRRKNRDRGNPTDLLQRLRSLHDLLDPTTVNTGEDKYVAHHERDREFTLDVDSRERQAPIEQPPATFDDDVPLLMDVVTPEELTRASMSEPDPVTAPAPAAAPSSEARRHLASDAEVIRALTAFERAVSRNLGEALDAGRSEALRADIRRSLARMLTELEAQWRRRIENNGR